jgi:hypothetical protein
LWPGTPIVSKSRWPENITYKFAHPLTPQCMAHAYRTCSLDSRYIHLFMPAHTAWNQKVRTIVSGGVSYLKLLSSLDAGSWCRTQYTSYVPYMPWSIQHVWSERCFTPSPSIVRTQFGATESMEIFFWFTYRRKDAPVHIKFGIIQDTGTSLQLFIRTLAGRSGNSSIYI